MIRDVKCVSYDSTYHDVEELLRSTEHRTIPLVESHSEFVIFVNLYSLWSSHVQSANKRLPGLRPYF
jgi:CBS-domain-containing membrane protein